MGRAERRIPELVGVLDADTAFPAGVWAQEGHLAALAAAGLQQAAGPAALLQAARCVEAAPPSAAAARCTRRRRRQAFLYC